MSVGRQAGPWLFSALVSAGVHVGAVAVLVAALPPLEAPAAPIQFVLALLEAPAQVEVEALTANAVVPAVATATEPAAASAQTVAADSQPATRVEAIAASIPQAQPLSAAPTPAAIAATAAIAGHAAIGRPQEQAGRLQPAAGARLPVTTTAAAAGAAGNSTIVPTASSLAPIGVAARAEAQAGSAVTTAAVPAENPASSVIAMETATAAVAAAVAGTASSVTTVQSIAPMAGAMETSMAVPTAPAVAPMSAAARAEGQVGNPQSAADPVLPTAGAAAPVVAGQGLPVARVEMTGAASTVTTALSARPVAGAQVQAPRPTVTPATPVVGVQTLPVVIGAEESGSANVAPAGAGPVTVTAALSASGATLAPLPPDVEPVAGLDAINDYLAGYDGGDCFAVLPSPPDDGAVALTAFAGSPAAAGDFIEALARDFGTLLPVEARAVSAEQCGALTFVRSSALYPGFDLGLALAADTIAAGSPISGEVLHMTGAWLTLVVIDDEGRVSNLDAYVQPEGEAIRFEAPVVPTGEAAGRTQLLLAVATAEQLATNPQDGEPAEAFLSALETELRMRGIRAELAVRAFTVR